MCGKGFVYEYYERGLSVFDESSFVMITQFAFGITVFREAIPFFLQLN